MRPALFDNTSVIVIYAYVLCDWGRQSLMIALSKLENNNATTNSLSHYECFACEQWLGPHSHLHPSSFASVLMAWQPSRATRMVSRNK